MRDLRIMNFVYDYSFSVTYCPASRVHLFGISTPVDPPLPVFFLDLVVLPLIVPFPLHTMAKTTKPKAANPPQDKNSGMESPHTGPTGGKKPGRTRRKPTAAVGSKPQQTRASDDEHEEPTILATDIPVLKIPARVVWDKYPERTERLLDYLDAHPDVAIKLFGDSTQAAKSNKAAAYLQVADGVFSIDDDPGVRADFTTNPNKYAKAVDNYITNT